jgi:hypothetical protein
MDNYSVDVDAEAMRLYRDNKEVASMSHDKMTGATVTIECRALNNQIETWFEGQCMFVYVPPFGSPVCDR